MKKLRIMLDTNILISASVFRSHTMNQIMTYVHDCHTLVISSYVMEELYEVIKRKFPGKIQNVEEFFSGIRYEYVHTPLNFDKKDLYIRDVKDYPVLYSAVTENIDILITGDKDFSELGMEKPEILTPAEFIKKYMQ